MRKSKWMVGAGSVIAISVWLMLGAGPGHHGGGRLRASGAGQGTAAQYVTYVGVDGALRNVGSIDTIGHRFSFGFTAERNGDGVVEGQMQLTDHDMGMSINSDVALLEVHTTHAAPHGERGFSLKMVSSTDSVVIDGEPQPDWKLVNSPTFDGGPHAADTVCFELFNADDIKILQWSAFVSAGNVQITGSRHRHDD